MSSHPMATPRPKVIHWTFSGTCNLECRFCYGTTVEGRLPLRDKLRILESIVEAGVGQLTFTGGEPLLDGDVFPVIARASAFGLYTSLHTNGLLLDGAARRLLKGRVTRLSLALDGSTEAMCLAMRGHPGFLDHALEILDWARQEGVLVTVKTVATRKNLADLPRLLELLQSRLAYDSRNLWYVSEFLPIKRGAVNREEFHVERADFDAFRRRIPPTPFKVLCKANDAIEQTPYFFVDALGAISTRDPVKGESALIGNILEMDAMEAWSRILAIHGDHLSTNPGLQVHIC